MRLCFLFGPAAGGKLTVARELVRLSGDRLFHNHLVVDLAAALFDFGTPAFVALRERLWLDCFRLAADAGASLVFTFHPEASVPPGFPERAREAVEERGGRVHFLEIVCPEEVLEQRIEDPSRAEFGKLASLQRYRELRDEGAFRYEPLPEPLARVDTSALSPAAAAHRLWEAIGAAEAG